MKFTKEHEWVEVEGDIATVGITDFAQGQLGEIVSIDLPKTGAQVIAGKEIAMVDSMKASSPIYSPVSGTIIELNAELDEQPQIINKSAQKDGWIVKIKVSHPDEINTLLSLEQYKKLLEESG